MIRHIVMTKIKEEYKDEIPGIIESYYGMKGQIDGLLEVESGADFLHSERSFDIALVTLFDSKESLEAYQKHPVHLPIKKRLHEIRCGTVACDYEI
jgi:hypothetical protein